MSSSTSSTTPGPLLAAAASTFNSNQQSGGVTTGKGTGNAASGQPGTGSASATTGSAAGGNKASPKDAQVIAAILKDMGVQEYEPRVLHQLLEFAYRYASNVLEDAVLYSTYAGKKSVDANDVRLAVEKLSDKMFTTPPPHDLLMELARHKNSIPLPPIKSHAGPRIPPDRYSLIACNYKSRRGIRTNPRPRPI